MPSASVLMTGADYAGNWKNQNGIPGQLVTRCRLIDLSATPASAGVGYEIMQLPSWTLLKELLFVKVSGCSSDDSEIQIGDANASQAIYGEISMSATTGWYQTRVASKGSIMAGCCFYNAGAKLQFVCSASQSVGTFWVVATTINLNPIL